MTGLLLGIVVSPLVGAVAAGTVRRRSERASTVLAAAAPAVGLALAVVLAFVVIRDGPVYAVTRDSGGSVVAGFVADRVAVLLLGLVCAVGAVVQGFAGRYLAGDLGHGRFVLTAGLLGTVSAGMVSAATVLGLAVAWTAAGAALCLLLAGYRRIPAARQALSRAARTFAPGDAALWIGVAAFTVRHGNVELRDVGAAMISDRPVEAGAVAVLVVLAALSRSAQVPLHRWLPASLGAPTPVSALLHAGVVNAGGVLLVRMWGLVGPSGAATWLAVAVGAASAVYGATLMRVRPDVKGSLVYSTIAQMGFMVMTCGLGLPALAVFHLVAHGLYKATLFLGSGAAVRRTVRSASAPPVPHRTLADRCLAVAVATAGVALVPLSWTIAGHNGDPATLVFVAGTVALVAGGWMAHRPGVRAAPAMLLALAVAVTAYLSLASVVARFLNPSIALVPFPHSVVIRLVVVGVLASVLAGVGVLARGTGASGGRLGAIRRAMYVWCVAAAYREPGRRQGWVRRSGRVPAQYPIPMGVRP